jgi:hypothetical protein
VAEGVERFEAPKVGKRIWRESMEPDASGLYCWFSDYEKEKTRADELAATDEAQLENRILELEAQRDQARQEVLEVREAVQPALDMAEELAERVNQELGDYTAYSSAMELVHEAEATLDPSGKQKHGHVCEPERPCEPNDHLCANYPSGEDCAPCEGTGFLDAFRLGPTGPFERDRPCYYCEGTGKKPVAEPSGEQGEEESLQERRERVGRDAEEKLRRVSRIIENGQSGGRSDAEILETIRDALESATAPWPPSQLRASSKEVGDDGDA